MAGYQILELLTDYGKIDILWLDGGWAAKTPIDQITSWYERQLEQSLNGYLKQVDKKPDYFLS